MASTAAREAPTATPTAAPEKKATARPGDFLAIHARGFMESLLSTKVMAALTPLAHFCLKSVELPITAMLECARAQLSLIRVSSARASAAVSVRAALLAVV
eukprot:CAMPEP_0172591632 /NCGR_PEP_ID=MMETSP1068-20121228/10462_1 /TAXON_ID=35684 /ORGANISM="Pseudopedinella elastica, Strain CCMP716" /LENGTH=100 /DNA_ID=CAMNT_0013388217 /DNA_START=223 /DNA_END=525 /DNA_ORIENTATION=+